MRSAYSSGIPLAFERIVFNLVILSNEFSVLPTQSQHVSVGTIVAGLKHAAGKRGILLMRLAKRFIIGMLLQLCRIARTISSFFPSRTVLWFTSWAGSVVGKFCSREEKISIAQIRYAFPEGLPERVLAANKSEWSSRPDFREFDTHGDKAEVSVEEYRALANRVFRHVGESVGELLLWKRFLRHRESILKRGVETGQRQEKIISEGADIIEDLRRSGVGAVGLSGHLGSFELLAAYLAECGLKCSVIGRSPNYPLLEKVIREFRQAFGVEIIWSDAADAPRQMVRAVRSGRVICALIDQDTKWKSDFSPFFGLEAASPAGPIQLAMRYELPIFTSFIVRTSPMSHLVTTETVPYCATDPEAKSKILRIYNDRLENLIRLHPEQYIWWHRRWRRRPGVDYGHSPQLLRNASQYREWLEGA